MKIEITNHINNEGEVSNAFDVKLGVNLAEGLCYGEVLGLVSAIIMPRERPCLNWLKSPEQIKAWNEYLSGERSELGDVSDVDYEENLNNKKNE